MKKLLLLVTLVCLMGCANLEQNAYRTIGTTAVLVDGAMNGWGDYVRNVKADGSVDASADLAKQELFVREAYSRYQKAMAAAAEVVRKYKAGEVSSGGLDLALQVVEATQFELVELVRYYER